MNQNLAGKRVLVMVANGVDEAAMSATMRELVRTGAAVTTVGIEPGLVNCWGASGWGLFFPVDQPLSQTLGADYDYLLVPAGGRGIQKLADNPHAERIISSFMTAQKPVAFMGDAAELLARTGHGGREGEDHVMTGESTDVPAFIEAMAAHFLAARGPAKAAA